MKNKNIVLLRTLLKSTSQFNILKHTTDAKKKGRIIGGMTMMVVLYLMVMSYCILMCIGYGVTGLTDSIPVVCALTIAALSFVLTLFKCNGYLFNFREYDMLMALPFEAKTIAADKFLYMYLKSLPWYLTIGVSMLAGYAVYAKPSVPVYPVWILLCLLLPVIPMLMASFIGFLIAKVGAGSTKKTMVQTVLISVIILFSFSIQYIMKAIFQNGKLEETMNAIDGVMDRAGSVYLPAGWFAGAVTDLNVPDLILFIALTGILFEAVFILMGRSYRKINSALKTHTTKKNFKMTAQQKKSLVNTIAFKEFKRMTGSTIYLSNIGMGEILAFAMGIVSLFLGLDRIIDVLTEGAPVTVEMMFPAIPLIVYFFIGMVPSTVCSMSLEGKNFWILQSLPINNKDVVKGKMLFNMYLTVPFMAFSTVCICISAKTPLLNMGLYLLEGLVLCAFSTAWGCVCGIRHMRLDWENEVEVIKQGPAVAIYLFPNMFITMGMVVLAVILGMKFEPNLICVIITAIMAVLALLSYRRAISLSRKL